jgi:hypothetical protein
MAEPHHLPCVLLLSASIAVVSARWPMGRATPRRRRQPVKYHSNAALATRAEGEDVSTQQASVDVRPRSYEPRTERRTFTETKLGAKTTEFYVAIVTMAAILIATYADGEDSLTHNEGWQYVAFVAIAYIVSRGLAKLGVREPYDSQSA